MRRRRVTALVALAALGVASVLAGCRAVRAERGEIGDRDEVTLSDGGSGIDVFRIRYGSVDVEGDRSVVSALLALPAGEPPDGGWPVVAYAHATTGAGDECDPSHDPSLGGVGASVGALADAGYIAVATDYEGIGTRGPHPYLHGASEAQAVVDSVLAARSMVGGDASTAWAVVGHSQGGHAALFTAQQAEELAPDLTLVGAVAIAPAADPAALIETIGSSAAALLVNGWLAVDDDADTTGLLTDAGAALVDAVEDECVVEPGTEVLRDGASSPGFDDYLAENVAGQEPAVAPVLVVQGTDDVVTPPSVARDVVTRLCELGSTVSVREYRGADHLTVVEPSAADVAEWLADRFAADPAPSDC